MFQSTRPRGARQSGKEVLRDCYWFQSTRPRGARLLLSSFPQKNRKFQSTRPRGARLKNQQQQNRVCQVSIHAPAWGATDAIDGVGLKSGGFNPRARVGRDG